MELKEAKKLAESAIAEGQRLAAAFDGTKHRFFFMGDSLVDAVPGFSPIASDKVSSEVSYPMPPVP